MLATGSCYPPNVAHSSPTLYLALVTQRRVRATPTLSMISCPSLAEKTSYFQAKISLNQWIEHVFFLLNDFYFLCFF